MPINWRVSCHYCHCLLWWNISALLNFWKGKKSDLISFVSLSMRFHVFLDPETIRNSLFEPWWFMKNITIMSVMCTIKLCTMWFYFNSCFNLCGNCPEKYLNMRNYLNFYFIYLIYPKELQFFKNLICTFTTSNFSFNSYCPFLKKYNSIKLNLMDNIIVSPNNIALVNVRIP